MTQLTERPDATQSSFGNESQAALRGGGVDEFVEGPPTPIRGPAESAAVDQVLTVQM